MAEKHRPAAPYKSRQKSLLRRGSQYLHYFNNIVKSVGLIGVLPHLFKHVVTLTKISAGFHGLSSYDKYTKMDPHWLSRRHQRGEVLSDSLSSYNTDPGTLILYRGLK
jgi:hypothetical protein